MLRKCDTDISRLMWTVSARSGDKDKHCPCEQCEESFKHKIKEEGRQGEGTAGLADRQPGHGLDREEKGQGLHCHQQKQHDDDDDVE